MGVDPISGLTTLTYTLPTSTVTLGDVFLYEPDPLGLNNKPSDLIRFGTGGKVYFFSDREATDLPPFDMADVVGIPSPEPAARPTVYLLETGFEGGASGALWTPLLATDPGFVGSVGPIVTYNIISDVPEPANLALLGLAGVAVLLRKRS